MKKKQKRAYLSVVKKPLILGLLLLGGFPLISSEGGRSSSEVFSECVEIQEDSQASRCLRGILLDIKEANSEEISALLTQILSVLDEGRFETIPMRYVSQGLTIQLMFQLIEANPTYPFLGHPDILGVFKSVIVPRFMGILSKLTADLDQGNVESLAQGLSVFHTWNQELSDFLSNHRSEFIHQGFDLIDLHKWYFTALRSTSVPEIEAALIMNMAKLPPIPKDLASDFNFEEYAQVILSKLQNGPYLLPQVLTLLQKSNWVFTDIQSAWPFKFRPEGAETIIQCLLRHVFPELPPYLQRQSIVVMAHQVYDSAESMQATLGVLRSISSQPDSLSAEASAVVSSLQSLSDTVSTLLQRVHEQRLSITESEQKSPLVLEEIKALKAFLSETKEISDFDRAKIVRILLHETYQFARENKSVLTESTKAILANTLMEALLLPQKFLSPLRLTPAEYAQFQQSILDELMKFPLMHEDFWLATQVAEGERIKSQFFPHFLLIHRIPGVTLSLANHEHKVAYLNILKILADARAYAAIGYRETYRYQPIADSINAEFRRPEGSPLALAYCSSLQYVDFDNPFQIKCQEINCANIPPFRRWEGDPDLIPLLHLVVSEVQDKSQLPEFYHVSLRLNEVASSVRKMVNAKRDTILYSPALSKMLNEVIKDEFVGCVKELHMVYGQISESHQSR